MYHALNPYECLSCHCAFAIVPAIVATQRPGSGHRLLAVLQHPVKGAP